MIPMTGDSEKLKYYVTDVRKEGENLVTVYGDKSVDVTPFSEHNLNVVRNRMIEQAQAYLQDYYGFIAKEILSTCIKEFVALISGVVGLFFLYNVDIHTIMKIIITVLGLGGEAFYFFLNKIRLTILGMGASEAEATEFYINNLDEFRSYDALTGREEYVLSIEDIANHKIPKEMLVNLLEKIQEFKAQGFQSGEMKLNFKPQPKRTNEK